jgi:hypothetical protein
MNGRIYDPLLGRFLSADIVVSRPGDLQAFNRYSYVRNNPLTLTDPSGFVPDGMIPYKDDVVAQAVGTKLSESLTDSFNSGKAHAEAGFSEIANASSSSTPVLGGTIGALHMVAMVAAAVDTTLAFTPEGKGEKVVVESAEKLATKAESALSRAVSQAEGAVEKVESRVASTEARVESAAVKTEATAEVKTATSPAAEVQQAAKSETPKETGSYTNHHESGKTYDGKGDKARSQTSARRIENETGDKHVATEWKSADNTRDAFKDESKRLDSHEGPKSPKNHNKIESPGKKMREEDGE